MFHSIIVFQGNKLFKEGKYELAKAKYEKVLIFLFCAKLNLMLLCSSVNIFLIENLVTWILWDFVYFVSVWISDFVVWIDLYITCIGFLLYIPW